MTHFESMGGLHESWCVCHWYEPSTMINSHSFQRLDIVLLLHCKTQKDVIKVTFSSFLERTTCNKSRDSDARHNKNIHVIAKITVRDILSNHIWTQSQTEIHKLGRFRYLRRPGWTSADTLRCAKPLFGLRDGFKFWPLSDRLHLEIHRPRKIAN